MNRKLIDPPLRNDFHNVWENLEREPGSNSPSLILMRSGKEFTAMAKVTQDGRKFIELPHNNRIYEGDWGYYNNSMGQDGQRIGHYSVPIDSWVSQVSSE
jgi:hypothetical protein